MNKKSVGGLRAVEYVRMSTAGQDQSLELQRQAIAAYALAHGHNIVRSYSDAGISGVTLQGRKGLQALLRDVMSEQRDFDFILVYDVSRWGRFQSSDESAYYEHHCRLNGAEVIYVAEPFKNDSSILGTLVKSMKRAMAGEYSRELSVKVRAGQEKIFRQGFSVSHNPHLGYRREIVSPILSRCIQLEPGERKAIQSDRVRVVLGPLDEQRLVRRIFKLYTTTDITFRGLTSLLNSEGHVAPGGRKFTTTIIRQILRNELYVGTAVWGLNCANLGGKRYERPERVIRMPNAVHPLVPLPTFLKAQKRMLLNQRGEPQTREELLSRLAQVLRDNRQVTSSTLTGHGLASEATYVRRFGSLGEAYRLIGHTPTRQGRFERSSYFLSMRYVEEISATLTDLGKV